MDFEEASFMFRLHKISPALTCQCDEFHTCQQCHEELKNETELNSLESQSYEG